jgi:hypothetical protein
MALHEAQVVDLEQLKGRMGTRSGADAAPAQHVFPMGCLTRKDDAVTVAAFDHEAVAGGIEVSGLIR